MDSDEDDAPLLFRRSQGTPEKPRPMNAGSSAQARPTQPPTNRAPANPPRPQSGAASGPAHGQRAGDGARPAATGQQPSRPSSGSAPRATSAGVKPELRRDDDDDKPIGVRAVANGGSPAGLKRPAAGAPSGNSSSGLQALQKRPKVEQQADGQQVKREPIRTSAPGGPASASAEKVKPELKRDPSGPGSSSAPRPLQQANGTSRPQQSAGPVRPSQHGAPGRPQQPGAAARQQSSQQQPGQQSGGPSPGAPKPRQPSRPGQPPSKPQTKKEISSSEEGSSDDESGSDESGSEESSSGEEESGSEESSSEEEDQPISKRASQDNGKPGTKAAPRASPASGSKSKSSAARGKGSSEGKSGGRRGGGKGKEDNTVKWTTLSHSGVIFPPPYTPHGIKMLYNKKPVTLTPEQEEVATMFAVMRETEYMNKPVFLKNFWEDWKKVLGKNHVIQRLDLCDFTPIWEWHVTEKEKKKQMTSEEKKRLKEEKAKAEEKYMWAIIDGVKEKVGNFRVEPPGLFRGRGEHPKMGKLKRRIMPEDITINIGKEATVPECPIPGHRWREVRHDNKVTWLAYWADPINSREFKYVFLAASSRLKGLSDMEKYEKARKLKDHIDTIRRTYTRNFTAKDVPARQIAVATYLIDRLALRAGNEKDDDEADTVGCCSLKVEHVTRVPPSSLQFDFLGKDSIRYFNTVEVEPPVYAAIGDFQKGKAKDEDLFDRLDTSKLNAHLKEIMPGLTAKVFRTYNASITLDRLLQDTIGNVVVEKVADYQRANKEVAILCNHQRTVSKGHAGQMEKLQAKIAELQTTVDELEEDLARVVKGKPPLKRPGKDSPAKAPSAEALDKKLSQAKARLEKMKLDMSIRDELKTVALGTSKINYLDPRITVAWCKRHDVPIEKIFNKSLLAKFTWAMDAEPDYRF